MGCTPSQDFVHSINNDQLDNSPKFDIDLNDPEVQKAATKIQAGFRGLQVRKEMKGGKGGPDDDKDANDVADIDLTDPDLAGAAVKIQAGFRGHIARKNLKKDDESGLNEKLEKLNTECDDPAGNKDTDELADIDLNDPELTKAASKIQATFRGHRSRKAQ
ncbi:uncharacterized protein LOC143035928 isoform X1 [Oratosquilla oratoria]|uniref:uncharacterized protein LOC143035928 isoform X1 n=1 Tax=Oratosquilla oratoria TaxID=337810 RepID=UPI003F75F444